MYKSIAYEKDVIEDVFKYNLESSKSPVLSQYYNNTKLWTLIKSSIKDEIVIKLMIFNLELNIAPLHTYAKYYEDELSNYQLSKYDKQCLGSVVALLFVSLGYQKTRQIYRKDSIIKYAAFFERTCSSNDATIKDGNNHGDSRNISQT